jgi:hypothetical protein
MVSTGVKVPRMKDARKRRTRLKEKRKKVYQPAPHQTRLNPLVAWYTRHPIQREKYIFGASNFDYELFATIMWKLGQGSANIT